ncbi:zinc-binding dehydrogenase [Altererythrobacter salegens]|uniref:Zinc-binding dehydrogenase n=1 Tax=Croceibacterium salegens TaxID=1737568 RepID=A0A6I4SX35_9SPHN|nr:quinone oxidoreductase [Croceibacterium salegens]MXO60644.1 zinc-binding dehydrogenase [Croceibacterium salegens]
MAKIVRFYKTGGPDVLKLEDIVMPAPAAGEVLVRQQAIGVNFVDITLRKGGIPAPLPSSLGSEAAGIVEAVGEGVAVFAPGDRVAYGGSPNGSYASERIVPAALLSKLPPSIDVETAAGMMSAGLTAGYLIRRIWPFLSEGDPILFHAAAGGVGQIAVQWAKAIGLKVIGTVGSEGKIATALGAGCDHVLVNGRDDIAARVKELTGGAGVAVAYDSIGKDTVEGSLNALRRRGLLVIFGAASGPAPDISPPALAMRGSLYMTRPSLFDYLADPDERASLVAEMFDLVVTGKISISINHKYALDDVASAHRDIEARATTGSVILIP